MNVLCLLNLHKPIPTGKRVAADFGKGNLPNGIRPVPSVGLEAVCKCKARFIIHDPSFGFPQKVTRLEVE